jgi:hypothetical protein
MNWLEEWVIPRAGLEVVRRRKISVPAQNRILSFSNFTDSAIPSNICDYDAFWTK